MSLLEADHLHFSYQLPSDQRLEILHDFCMDIAPGEILTLLGPSGCGKSTLLKLLAGFLRPVNGQIRYDSENLASPFPSGQMIFSGQFTASAMADSV